MLAKILFDATASCPLEITKTAWIEPTLTIGGNNWSFSTMNPWRIVAPGGIVGSSDEQNESIIVSLLKNATVVSFSTLKTVLDIDLSIDLNDGRSVQVFAMDMHENWVLRLPNQPTITFVPTN